MPRNKLDQKAHTRAMNRANHELRMRYPQQWAELYAEHFQEAKREVRDTDGLPFQCGPRPASGEPVIDMDRLSTQLDSGACPGCSAHHERHHFCPECGSDIEDWHAAPTPDARMEMLLRMRCLHCGVAGPYREQPCRPVVGGRPRKRAAHEFTLIPEVAQGVQVVRMGASG